MVTSSPAQSFTILTEDDGIPGSKFEKEPEEYTVAEVPRIEAERKKRGIIKSCQRLHCEWQSPET